MPRELFYWFSLSGHGNAILEFVEDTNSLRESVMFRQIVLNKFIYLHIIITFCVTSFGLLFHFLNALYITKLLLTILKISSMRDCS